MSSKSIFKYFFTEITIQQLQKCRETFYSFYYEQYQISINFWEGIMIFLSQMYLKRLKNKLLGRQLFLADSKI